MQHSFTGFMQHSFTGFMQHSFKGFSAICVNPPPTFHSDPDVARSHSKIV